MSVHPAYRNPSLLSREQPFVEATPRTPSANTKSWSLLSREQPFVEAPSNPHHPTTTQTPVAALARAALR